MIIEIPYKSKVDGEVKLIKRISGIYLEDGKTIIPTGFMIRKVGTNELYNEAIDIETAPYQYEETDIKIDGEFSDSDISDAEFRALIEEAL